MRRDNMLRTYQPGKVRRPWVGWPVLRCDAVEGSQGFTCTRREGHSGRHSAGGSRDHDGLCSVYGVWPQEVAEPCS